MRAHTDPSARACGIGIVAAAVCLPLLGAWAAGRDLAEFFQFPPPLAMPAGYPRFSWNAAVLVLLPFAAAAASWLRVLARREAKAARRRRAAPPARGLPAWGRAAVGWTFAWWILAWGRFPWFGPVQAYTFLPLWLGFVVSVNAVVWGRTGTCLMVRRPGLWTGLFALSAGFWWLFEWLNRFVGNWHYLGVEGFGAGAYALNASLCFSTVLPAVAGVREWLASHPRWMEGCASGPAWGWLANRTVGRLFIAGGVAALLMTGARPTRFYPSLWAAPLALAIGESILSGRPGIRTEVAAGDWRRAASWAVAALCCGFFWELWNWRSLAHWVYTVPYVDRWHLFAMPLLGYTGYLPFGLECLIVCERAFGLDRLEARELQPP